MAGWCEACAVSVHLSAFERVDNLGTEVSRTRSWIGLVADGHGASYYRWSGDLVLCQRAVLAGAADLHLSKVGDSFIAISRLCAIGRSNSCLNPVLASAGKIRPRRVLCCRLLCHLAVSCPWLFQRVF